MQRFRGLREEGRKRLSFWTCFGRWLTSRFEELPFGPRLGGLLFLPFSTLRRCPVDHLSFHNSIMWNSSQQTLDELAVCEDVDHSDLSAAGRQSNRLRAVPARMSRGYRHPTVLHRSFRLKLFIFCYAQLSHQTIVSSCRPNFDFSYLVSSSTQSFTFFFFFFLFIISRHQKH